MRVSVVICTLDRADSLRDTLVALGQQNYDDIEVVVVNGPSTDGTDHVLREFAGSVRAEHCPIANLSVSRNIGIRASAGDIVAFIDDDAIPEFDWLNQAIPAFADPEVGGVGGIVIDHTGVALQYRFSAANRLGQVFWSQRAPFDLLSVPGAATFPYLQGTNSMFRREVLEQVGGFDETYEYYLDETDLCCRIVDAGYVLRQLPNAAVHHKVLPSNVRNHHKVVTNEFPLVKNHTYFAFRHALSEHGEEAVLDSAQRFVESRIADVRAHELAGRLPRGAADSARHVALEALAAGAELGRARHDLRLGPVEWPRSTFTRFPARARLHRRRYVLVSSGYGTNITGGVARYTTDLAAELAVYGAEVRVLTSTTEPSTVDLENGIWVHRLRPEHVGHDGVAPTTFETINNFTTAVANEITRISEWAPVDVVYGAIWDVEPLGALRRTGLPVIIHLVTPAAIAATQAGWLEHNDARRGLESLLALEREVLSAGDVLHANGQSVMATVADHYPGTFDPARVHVAHLGLVDRSLVDSRIRSARASHPAGTGDLNVLFVGRLETRKGIDLVFGTIVALADRYPQVSWTIAGADTAATPGGRLIGAEFRKRHRSAAWVDRVRFTGAVPDEELHNLYGACDIALLPSRYESFGLVMVEAMMHGKALISTSVGGIGEVVRNNTDGVLVPPGQLAPLVRTLEELLNDPGRRRRLGSTARRRFLEHLAIGPATARFTNMARRVRSCPLEPPWVTFDGAVERVRSAGRHPAVLIDNSVTCRMELSHSALWRVALRAIGGPVKVAILSDGVLQLHDVGTVNYIRLDVRQGDSIRVEGKGRAEIGGLIGLDGPVAR